MEKTEKSRQLIQSHNQLLEKIISLVSNIFGISPEDILVKRKGNIYRTLAVLPNISPNTYHLEHFVYTIYQLCNRFSK